MALRQQVNIHQLQREMMAVDAREEQIQASRALAGKTGAQWGDTLRNGKRQREGFKPHYPNAGISNPNIGRNYRSDKELDVHEILKRDAFASSAKSCNDHFEKNRPCPGAVYGVSDQYVILDSFEKVETSRPDRGEFQFNFMVQGVTRNQAIGVKDKLDTIIGVQVCSFCIPLLPPDKFALADIVTLNPGLVELGLMSNGVLPTNGTNVTNAQSQTPFCGRITMFLKEIGLQSFSDADNRRHHFEFYVDPVGATSTAHPNGDHLRLKPLENCGYFLFTDPIQDIHGLTICFYNPSNVLRFPPDCLYGVGVATNSAQLITLTFTDPTNLLNLEVNDRIYIRGFVTTTYPLLDSYITRPEGHIVGAGGYTLVGPTPQGNTVTFRLNPDISTAGLTPPIPANTQIVSSKQVVVCIAKNRIRIPLRFRRIVDRLTNYTAP